MWWQNAKTVTLLVAVIAAVAPLTTGIQTYLQARNQLQLERSKQLHEMRQQYLDRVLSDTQSQRVLEFLVAVEDDEKLKKWATNNLEQTKSRIQTKKELYHETIRTVAALANQKDSIDKKSPTYIAFWTLYNEKLLPVESTAVEGIMVIIGKELKRLSTGKVSPSENLRALSFRLSRTMKKELR